MKSFSTLFPGMVLIFSFRGGKFYGGQVVSFNGVMLP